MGTVCVCVCVWVWVVMGALCGLVCGLWLGCVLCVLVCVCVFRVLFQGARGKCEGSDEDEEGIIKGCKACKITSPVM